MSNGLTFIPFLAEPIFASSNLTYRLHHIEISHVGDDLVGSIYDGEEVVHTVRDSNQLRVIQRAKEWIDEQDEIAPQFDLHVAA